MSGQDLFTFLSGAANFRIDTQVTWAAAPVEPTSMLFLLGLSTLGLARAPALTGAVMAVV